MKNLLPKWNPTVSQARRIPPLMNQQKAANAAMLKKEKKINFEPNTESQGVKEITDNDKEGDMI